MVNLKIELDGLRQSIIHSLETQNNEFSEMIQKEINHQFTQGWVQVRIREGVTDCINKSIDSLTDDYRLRNAIKDAIINQLVGEI